ncbi:MAG: phosphate acyltransferase [Gemmatimonadota bacterium]
MNGLAPILEKMRARSPRLVLVSAGGEEIGRAVERFERYRLGSAVVVGEGGIQPSDDPRSDAVANLLRERAPDRVRDGIHALDLAAEPLRFAVGLVGLGQADLCVAGPGFDAEALAHATAWIAGPGQPWPDLGWLGYLLTTDERWLTIGVPSTLTARDPRRLAELAVAAADHRGRTMSEPLRVGFLAGPGGEVGGPVLPEFAAQAPGIVAGIDGPAGVGDPRFRGRANVLIFPDAVSAYLATRFARDFGAVRVLGPIYPCPPGRAVAGLADGATADDIVAVAAIATAGLPRS